jgi:indoleamine 2,3-dioxygenase
MPQTPLTKILHEFRAYRPLPHREFLTYIREKSEEIGVQDYAVQDSETAVLFLRTLNHVRSFRWRHWLFAREYIIRRTPHPTATGGSPIVTVSIPPYPRHGMQELVAYLCIISLFVKPRLIHL